jgi:hypothetical protein
MPIDLLGVGTDRRHGGFQLPTPNRSIGPSEVARDGFKVGWSRLVQLLFKMTVENYRLSVVGGKQNCSDRKYCIVDHKVLQSGVLMKFNISELRPTESYR